MRYFRLAPAVLLLVFITIACSAQDVIYSQYDKFDLHEGDYDVVGQTGDFFYNYISSGPDHMLIAYDDSMNKEATIILDFFPNKIYRTRFISYADKIIVLYQALERNTVVQYAAVLDEKARLKGRPIELGSVKTGIFGAMKSYFYAAVSEDKKTILVYTFNDKASGIEFDCKWLNDSLQIVKRGHGTFSVDKSLSSGEVTVGNDGTVYVSAYTTLGSQNNADRFWILTLAPGDNKFNAHQLQLNGKFAASGYSKIDNLNHRVYFGGFYTNHKNGSYEGVIFASFNPSANEFETQKFIPFDDVLKEAGGLNQRSGAFDNYMVRQLNLKNDGGFVMISEINYITTRSNFAPGLGYYSSFYSPYSTSTVKEYHFNDILAVSYDKSGVREWNTIIPKEQYSQEDGGKFSSFLMLKTGGALGFLYNDFNAKHSRIQLSTVDAGGKTNNSSFAVGGNDSPDWLPRAGKQVAARTLIVPCLHKRQICFAKVVF